MSGLVQLKQRIKAIQTIKKITHAMRIVSMSTHARLRHQQHTLKEYKHALMTMYAAIKTKLDQSKSDTEQEIEQRKGPVLFIVVGSQKGLCGNFNNTLFNFVKGPLEHAAVPYDLISVGKKTNDYLASIAITPRLSYEEFTSTHLATVTASLVHNILDETQYSEVFLMSMSSQSFFNQKPHRTRLLPFEAPAVETQESAQEYRWETPAEELADYALRELLATQLYEALLASLIAEQAARFIAMDNSTRNAANLLDAMTLRYNKTRQAKITRELTDLASSF
jgi:F-type H+-transporting ATPase subunit gamma